MSKFLAEKLWNEAFSAHAEVVARVEALELHPLIPFILTPQSQTNIPNYRHFFYEPQNTKKMSRILAGAEEMRKTVDFSSRNILDGNIFGLKSTVSRSEKLFTDVMLEKVNVKDDNYM